MSLHLANLAMIPAGSYTRSKIAASSVSGLFTRVEIAHMVIGSEMASAKRWLHDGD